MAFLLCLFGAAPAVQGQVRANYGSAADGSTTEKLADGVFAFLAPDSRTPFVSGNSMAVIGRDGVLVVDSGHVPAVTRRVIAEIKRLTDKPVRFVVNTHWHFDHVVGNGEYRAAFPGVEIVSTPATRTRIEAQLPGYASDLPKQVPSMLDRLRDLLKKGSRSDGTPLSAPDRAFYEAEVTDFTAAMHAIGEMTYAPPNVTFDRELDVDLGGRTVRVLFLGRGNTAGDAVVYVPDAKVVATGDLVVAPVPYATASFMFDWPETMRKLMAMDAVAVVPGHGPVLHDWKYAGRVTALIESVGTQVSKAVADGLSLEDTRRRVDVTAFRRELAGDDPFQQRVFDTFFIPGAVERAYREAYFRSEREGGS